MIFGSLLLGLLGMLLGCFVFTDMRFTDPLSMLLGTIKRVEVRSVVIEGLKCGHRVESSPTNI